MMRFAQLALILFLFVDSTFASKVSSVNHSAQPTTRLTEIRTRGILRVGTTGDYKPFSYRTNANSPYIGFDIEMAQALANELGVKLELVPTSWPSLMNDLANNRFDVAMSGVSISAARQKLAMFSIAYLQDGKTPITLCVNQTRFQSLAQIDQADVRVVVNPGGTNESFARANLQRAQLIVYPDNNHIFDQIVEGNADLMITDAVEARLQQQLKPGLCAVHPETPFNLSEKAYLLPQDAAWKAFVDSWLQPYLEQGKLTKSLDKWLQHSWPQVSSSAIQINELRDLMARRLSMMEDVARHKWNQQSAIEDLPREQKIIASLQVQATALGIPAVWAEHFFRAQIEAAKQIQRECFVRWQSQQQGKFDHVPNLETVIRPQLDQLTTQILKQLAMTWPALVDTKEQQRIIQSMQALKDSPLSEKTVHLAITPLVDGSALR